MIKVEGYKAFRGTMLITPKNPQFEPFTVTGEWLYKPEYDCWYCGGRSYMAGVCEVITDDT